MFEVSLKDKICIITGASQGIGKATALTFGKADLKGMTIIDIAKGESGEAVEKELTDMGVEVEYIVGDASSVEVIQGAVQKTMDRWGKIDILCNIAGISYMTDLETTSPEQWDKVMNVNIRSVFLTMKYVSEIMKKQGYGSIVNMSSISGVTGGSTGPEYGASKAGIIALTKYSAKILGKYNIRVNAVSPGTTLTPSLEDRINQAPDPEKMKQEFFDRQPIGRLGYPEEIARAILFAADERAGFMDGENIQIDGGMVI